MDTYQNSRTDVFDFRCFNACATLLEALENGDTRGGGVGGGGVLLVILSEDGCQDALRGSSSFADDGFKKGEKATERTKKSDLTADASERVF